MKQTIKNYWTLLLGAIRFKIFVARANMLHMSTGKRYYVILILISNFLSSVMTTSNDSRKCASLKRVYRILLSWSLVCISPIVEVRLKAKWMKQPKLQNLILGSGISKTNLASNNKGRLTPPF